VAITRGTWIAGITFVLFLALVSLAVLGGMNSVCTVSQATRAKLSIINSAISTCPIENPLPNHFRECIRRYAASLGIPPSGEILFSYDNYGELLVLEPSEQCHGEFEGPYSKGPNRIDECGQGDDIR
jgi:hypothetical protein